MESIVRSEVSPPLRVGDEVVIFSQESGQVVHSFDSYQVDEEQATQPMSDEESEIFASDDEPVS